MADKTGIEWTDATWNPVRGCTRVSEGCRNCYAETVAARFNGPGQPYEGLASRTSSGPRWTGKVRFVEEHLTQPIRWKRPRKIFVNSMSDLFHESLSFEQIDQVMGIISAADQHIFQVLTKRPKRMREYFSSRTFVGCWRGPKPEPLPWLWLGTSVEDQSTADERVPELLGTPAALRFVSYEPALGAVDFTKVDLQKRDRDWETWTDALAGAAFTCDSHAEVDVECNRLDWIICGGESGPNARPMHPDWARSVRDQCQAAGVPFFFKQWGEWVDASHPLFGRLPEAALAWIDSAGRILNPPPTSEHADCLTMKRVGKKVAGNLLDGQVWQQFPQPERTP